MRRKFTFLNGKVLLSLFVAVFLFVGSGNVWAAAGDVLYSAYFPTSTNSAYGINKNITVNSKTWTVSASQMNSSVFYLGVNSGNAAMGILAGTASTNPNNAGFWNDAISAWQAADLTYSATGHAYAMLFNNSYSDVGEIKFDWAGANGICSMYLFADMGSGYQLLATDYTANGAAISGSVSYTFSVKTTVNKILLIARPTNPTTNSTVRITNFSLKEGASCLTDPTFGTSSSKNPTATTITLANTGFLTVGDCSISEYGFVWGPTANPTIADNKVQVGTTYPTAGVAFTDATISSGLTCNTQYHYRAYMITASGPTPKYDTDKTFTTAACPAYDVTLDAGAGSLGGQTDFFGGTNSVTLPATDPVLSSACILEGWVFEGWSETQDGSTFVSTPYIPSGSITNITLYAVYSKTTGGGTSWNEVTGASNVTAGTYVITFENDGDLGNYFYLPSETAMSNPSASTGILISGGKLTNVVSNAMQWDFTGDNTTGFVVSHTVGLTTYTLASTNAAQGISVVTTSNSTTWKALDSPNAIYTGLLLRGSDGGTRNLAIFNNATPNWRYYSSFGSGNYYGWLRLFKKTASSVTIYDSNPSCASCALPTLDELILDGTKTDESIELLAQLLSDGGCTTEYGFVYNTTGMPVVPEGQTPSGEALDGDGMYYGLITGLTANTAYWIRAYATNAAGTVYSDPIQVTTNPTRCSVKPDAYDADPVGQNSFTAQWDGDVGDFILNVYTKIMAPKNETEDFSGFTHNNAAPPALPKILTSPFQHAGWTMSVANKNVYITVGNCVVAPALSFSVTGDFVQTASYEAPITTFEFWALKEGSTTGTSSITIWGFDSGSWQVIETKLIQDFNTAGVHSCDLTGFNDTRQIKIEFTKVTGGCNLAIDNIHVITDDILTKVPVTGYEDLVVTGSSEEVTGLDPLSTYYYTVKAKGNDCISVESDEIEVKTCGKIYWLGTVSDRWNNGANWDVNRAPKAGDHAFIEPTYPGFASPARYPILQAGDNAVCDTITFGVDAKLGKQHLLTYNKAIVNYGLIPTRWYTLATPIAATVQDFHREYQPSTWVQRFGKHYGANQQWNFISPLDVPLEIGAGFGFYYKSDYPLTKPFSLTGEMAGATVTEDLYWGNDGSDTFALLGNPFMTTIDFVGVYLEGTTNSAIGSTYYVFNSHSNYSGYEVEEGEYIGAPGDEIDEFIAPLQSFIVQKENENDKIEFSHEMQATDAPASLRSSVAKTDLLSIVASNPLTSIRTIVAQRESKKQSNKLFDKLSEIPDIYTLGNGKAYGLQRIQTDDVLIPLGLRTNYAGEMSFTFTGMDSYNAHITFSDVLTGANIDLTDLATYTYELNYTPVSNNEEGRFFILFAPKAPNNIVTISDGIVGQRYYNLQGVEIARPVEQGVYLVKNLFESGRTSVVKVIR